MSTFTKKRTSPSRDRLQECHTARQDAEAKIAEINASLARLADHEQAVLAARSELQALDAEDAAKVHAWAKSGEGSAPTTDVDKRESIARALSQAEAQSKAAAAARAALTAEMETAMRPLQDVEAWTKVSIPLIAIEEAESLMAGLRETMAQMASQKNRLDQIRTFVLAQADAARESNSPGMSEIFRAQEAFHQDLQLAGSLPPSDLDDSAAAHQALMAFVRDLRSDAHVALAA
jgi:hypothetical protein